MLEALLISECLAHASGGSFFDHGIDATLCQGIHDSKHRFALLCFRFEKKTLQLLE
jgi:hypothetical protein